MHPAEQQLIDYEFKLSSGAQAGEVAEHLAQCEDCQRRLDGLRRKFAALDLLRDEPGASEDLISRAVAQARRP
ncbi:MAG: hypothetical protein JSU70_06135, partial [Phycisphaerales bacterium]